MIKRKLARGARAHLSKLQRLLVALGVSIFLIGMLAPAASSVVPSAQESAAPANDDAEVPTMEWVVEHEFGDSTLGDVGVLVETWAACGNFDDNSKLVRIFDTDANSNAAYLRCGSPNWGYRHIFNDHKWDWESMGWVVGELQWRRMADWAIHYTLNFPEDKTLQYHNDTWRYEKQVHLRDDYGNIVDSRDIVVVVARASRNIITAYPTG